MSKRNDTRNIEVRQLKGGGASYRVDVQHPVTKDRYKETFRSLEAAQRARDTFLLNAENQHQGIAPKITVEAAIERLLIELHAGTYKAKGGVTYKASTLRLYEDTLNRLVKPAIGKMQLRDVRDDQLQALVDSWVANGAASGTIQNRWVSIRVLFRFALKRKLLIGAMNPCDLVERPSTADSRRDRVASVTEAQQYLNALETEPLSQLVYALAFFTGLRRGELQGLRWEDVDLAGGKLRVLRSFDDGIKRGEAPASIEVLDWPDRLQGAFVKPKSRAAVRAVPIPQAAVRYLAKQDRTAGLVCGREHNVPFTGHELNVARETWKRLGMEPIVLHEARHTYASYMIAAGCNAKALQTYMGHSSITVTFDLYGHMFPGNEVESAALLDAYLEAALA